MTIETGRPPLHQRCFTSEAVEATIDRVRTRMADAELGQLFANALPNTLDTTVDFTDGARPDTFVITGDIPAMWLRDSTAQVWPYLALAPTEPRLQRMLAGVVNRQVDCVLIDPYANAFNKGQEGSQWADDRTAMRPELHERKWELDSLCSVIRLGHGYWQACGDTSPFDDHWARAMALVVQTMRAQQRRDGPGPYRFQRMALSPTDTLPFDGEGWPARPNGLIRSGFRPSDDACQYPYLIPANFMAVTALRQLDALATALGRVALAESARGLADEVAAALPTEGVLPYETDGYGNALYMDDANVPSLLSLPYLGCLSVDDPRYRATRAFVLSEDNPFFFRGRAGCGIGGPHCGLGMIWPIALTMQAMTSTDDAEILRCLGMLKASHAGTGFMHESFHQDDVRRFTRPWFAWANSLFGELVLRLDAHRPHLLRQQLPDIGPA
ncbi:glycoside hydrolase family 125 protein [Sphaerotilus montanus]|uniref:glycoside hydrolase family 125 protein n=1 Tax=Sphaerotilus montanus TaxID=522889 RepID=UPI003FA33824